ncbi:MAG: HAMP domain-containing sensor histidine kinase, partial [Candidatus Tectomicrobia bacterium]
MTAARFRHPRVSRRRIQMSPERRLQGLVLLCLVCVAVPLAVLFARVYAQLRQESLYQYRFSAEQVVQLINDKLAALMAREENRPFAHYGFFSVEEQKLLQTKGLALSPLSRFPVVSDIPGIIGYFQLNPAGRLSSPVLPDITAEQLQAYDMQVSEAEYARRLALKQRLEAVLRRNRLLVSKAKRSAASKAQDRQTPSPADAFSAREMAPEPKPTRQREDAAGAEQDETEVTLRSTYHGQKLAELQIDERLHERQQGRKERAAKRRTDDTPQVSGALLRKQRTEQIDIPANQSIEAYRTFLGSNTVPTPAAQEARPAAPAHKAEALLVSFEGDIDPIQFYVLQDATFAFVRKVWKAKQRYIQGFLVDGHQFLQQVMHLPLQRSNLARVSRVVVSYRQQVLAHLDLLPTSYGRQSGGLFNRSRTSQDLKGATLLYTAHLSPPFDDMTVLFTITALPLGPGATIVHLLALLIPAILLAGFFSIQRLAARQMQLARAHHDFVAAVSHELKTPLTSIRMYGEMLRSGWVQDDTKRQTYYDFIFYESERLSRLVANVLHLARLTNHDTALALQPHTPAALLDLARAKVYSQVEAAGFTLDVVNRLSEAENHTYLIEAEEDAFTRIVINLVDNALKFAAHAEEKVVRLELRALSGSKPVVIFAVRDYGPGVERDQMKKIFQLFYRPGSELTRTTPGTGIGLALVQELAATMDAEVDLSRQRPGAEFQIKFRVRTSETRH